MWTLSQRKYAKSIKGIEARKQFQQSEKGKALKAKYLAKRKARLQEARKKEATVKAPVETQLKVEKLPKITKEIIK